MCLCFYVTSSITHTPLTHTHTHTQWCTSFPSQTGAGLPVLGLTDAKIGRGTSACGQKFPEVFIWSYEAQVLASLPTLWLCPPLQFQSCLESTWIRAYHFHTLFASALRMNSTLYTAQSMGLLSAFQPSLLPSALCLPGSGHSSSLLSVPGKSGNKHITGQLIKRLPLVIQDSVQVSLLEKELM